jgi:hypothetical protein
MTFVIICAILIASDRTAMSRAIQLHNHPFRFLLYLEWGLLTVAIISMLDAPPGHPPRHGGPPPGWEHSPLMALIPLIFFGLMGLYLPVGKLARLGHTLAQILLILLSLAAAFNDGRITPVVYLVLVIRGCLMFRSQSPAPAAPESKSVCPSRQSPLSAS